MKIRFEFNSIESKSIIAATTEITGDNISYEAFIKKETESHKWGSVSKGDGAVEFELHQDFIIDCIDAVKPFAIMVKGIIPAFKGLLEQAQNRMSKWNEDIRELSQDVAKDLWERNNHDVVVVTGYLTHDWVEYKPGIKKFSEVGVHTPIIKKSELEKILASDKDAKFYIFDTDGGFKEATILEVAAKLW